MNNDEEWSIYYSNIRGYKSKCESLTSIINGLDPNIIVLNETGLKFREKLKIENYKSFNRNRQDKNMGGVSISVRDDETKHVVKSSEGKDDDEYLITRHDQFNPAINIITIYGEQENRTISKDAEEKWENILGELS